MLKSFLAVTESLTNASNFINLELENANCDLKTANQILVAFEEIFINIVHYAYPDGKGNIEVEIIVQNKIVTIKFIDSGIPFNPLEKDDPDITLSIAQRDIGGLRNIYCEENDG